MTTRQKVEMKTEQLYKFDSYRRTFDGVVQESSPSGVILDQTAFYPNGGGQPNDRGALQAGSDRWLVSNVELDHGKITHAIEGIPPKTGTKVRGSVDWDLRFRYMRLHTALHALSGVVWSGWGADVTGSHIAKTGDRARMDFALEGIRINTIRQEIEDKLNEELAVSREVKVYSLPRTEAFALPDLIRTHVNLLPKDIQDVRIVDIVDLDRQADGGTHVANTSEVGRVQILNAVNKGRINRRLEISLVDTS